MMNLNRRSVKFADSPEVVRFSYRQPQWTVVHSTSGILKRPELSRSAYYEVQISDGEDVDEEENRFSRSYDQQVTRTRSRVSVPLSGSMDSLVSTEESNTSNGSSSSGMFNGGGWPIMGTMTLGRKFSNRRRYNVLLADQQQSKCQLQAKPALFRRYTPPGEQPTVAAAPTRIKIREQPKRWRPHNYDDYEDDGAEGKYDEFEMSNHVKDCLGQFTTALDKVLSARKMLEEDADLDNSDRQVLLHMLNQNINSQMEKICQLQGKGGFDDSSSRSESSINSHRNGSSVSGQRQSVVSSGIQIDQTFLDAHGPQILALLQQRVPSKHN
ncbi:hypothetical protein L596_011297 [Steinernema carpocapsae]|uniref:Uncharacterized protein n=1 Tax=Steinernema carpocapsae TaxID=34508 RepID=A0A4U5NTF9_STECR|nr:hypothetical protein L596_011297 [Steinernema carpocapsae]